MLIIARPRPRDALPARAPKLPRSTDAVLATALVGAVAAVVALVAALEGEGAVEVVALKLTRSTVPHRCNEEEAQLSAILTTSSWMTSLTAVVRFI